MTSYGHSYCLFSDADFSLVNYLISNFFYILIIVNPSPFQNGMTLENLVKIEGAMSKNVGSSVLTALKCQNFGGAI